MRARAIQRKRGREKDRGKRVNGIYALTMYVCVCARARAPLCVCPFVCGLEREEGVFLSLRWGGGGRGGEGGYDLCGRKHGNGVDVGWLRGRQFSWGLAFTKKHSYYLSLRRGGGGGGGNSGC